MNKKTLGNVIICIVLFFCGAFFLQKFFDSPDVVTFLKPPVESSAEVKHLADSFKLEHFEVKFGQVGNKVDASFVLHNESDVDVRNVRVLCTMHDENGTQWSDGVWELYSVIPANDKKEIHVADKRYVSHRAVSRESECRIVDLKIMGDYMIAASSEHGESQAQEDGHH